MKIGLGMGVWYMRTSAREGIAVRAIAHGAPAAPTDTPPPPTPPPSLWPWSVPAAASPFSWPAVVSVSAPGGLAADRVPRRRLVAGLAAVGLAAAEWSVAEAGAVEGAAAEAVVEEAAAMVSSASHSPK